LPEEDAAREVIAVEAGETAAEVESLLPTRNSP